MLDVDWTIQKIMNFKKLHLILFDLLLLCSGCELKGSTFKTSNSNF